MAQLILDDQLAASEVLIPVRRWFSAVRLRDVLPGEQILDDRIPEVLLGLKQPTFVTIDQGFWDRRLCNSGYCVLYFALRDDQQDLLPGLLRRVLRRPEFRAGSRRMGIVARISSRYVDYWEFRSQKLTHLIWR